MLLFECKNYTKFKCVKKFGNLKLNCPKYEGNGEEEYENNNKNLSYPPPEV